MAKYWTEAMIVMKLTWFKVFLCFFIPFGLSLQQQTENWDGKTWDEKRGFELMRVFFVATVIGATALQAFFDKTSQKVETELAKHRAEVKAQEEGGNGNTQQFLNKL